MFLACQENFREKDGLLVIDVEEIKLTNKPYVIQRLIPLETTSENLLKEYLLIRFNQNGYFVRDQEKKDGIHHFDLNGRYKGKILEVGEGPGMAENISDFIATEDGVEVLVIRGDKSEIWIFDLEYIQIGKLEFDYLASTFSKLPNGNYALCGSYNKPIVMHRMSIFDALGNSLGEFLPNDYTNEILPVGEQNFNTTKNGIYFQEFYNPKVFEITNGDLVATYELDLGKYTIPDQYWEMDWMQGFEFINKNGFGFPSHYFENEERAFFGVNIQANNQLKNYQIILDKKSSTIEKRIFGSEESPVFHQLVGLFGDHLVFLAQAADILDLDPEYLKATQINLSKDDNPVLVFVKF